MRQAMLVAATASCLQACLAATGTYTLDGSRLGRVFDGVGALSGGGATSRLLPDYPEEQRSQILDLLFKPRFGASLHTLKVEVGGDTFSGCGTEPSHWREPGDESFERGYEWWLMEEAAKRNPAIQGYGLPWGMPAWIGSGALNQNMANYMTRFVAGAKSVHGFHIGYLGIWNEDSWTPDYTKLLRATLDAAGLNDTRLVVSDNGLFSFDVIADQMAADPEFAAAVDVLGVHYPSASTTSAKALASGKTLWSSEDSSTRDDATGAGCWARILNWNWVVGNYTSTIMWNLASAYMQPLRWYGDSLLNAAQPWSGHYEVNGPVWTTAHTTQFTAPGWVYLAHGAGSGHLAGGGTYVTLVSPAVAALAPGVAAGAGEAEADFTIVVETMTLNHSLCIRSNPTKPWAVATQTVSFQLAGGLEKVAAGKPLHVWKSLLVAGPGDEQAYYFRRLPGIKPSAEGVITFSIEPDAQLTISTTTGQQKGDFPAAPVPPAAPFPMPYSDDFDGGYRNDSMARYFSDQAGSFAAVALPLDSGAAPIVAGGGGRGAPNATAMAQLVRHSPSDNGTAWHAQDSLWPITLIGDYAAADYNVSVSFALIEAAAPTPARNPRPSLAACDAADPRQAWHYGAQPGVLPMSIIAGRGGGGGGGGAAPVPAGSGAGPSRGASAAAPATAQCLDVDGCIALPGAQAWMWACVDRSKGMNCESRNQQWNITAEGRIVTAMTTGFCLTGPDLTMQPCVGAADARVDAAAASLAANQTWSYDAATGAIAWRGASDSRVAGTRDAPTGSQPSLPGQCLSSARPVTPSETQATIGVRLGGPLQAEGCGGAPRENRCVEAYSRSFYNYGYFLHVQAGGNWSLTAGVPLKDAPRVLASGSGLDVPVARSPPAWRRLSLSVSGQPARLSGNIDGRVLFADVADPTGAYANGWAGLGSGWHVAAFDDFELRAAAATLGQQASPV